MWVAMVWDLAASKDLLLGRWDLAISVCALCTMKRAQDTGLVVKGMNEIMYHSKS